MLAFLAGTPVEADVSSPTGTGGQANVVVLDTKRAQACFRRDFGFFTPREADVRAVERLLPSALATEAEEEPSSLMREMARRVSSHFAGDTRFYFGRVEEDGTRSLDVYGACPRLVDSALRCPPNVDDPQQDCLWYVSFDLVRRRLVGFNVHGVIGTIVHEGGPESTPARGRDVLSAEEARRCFRHGDFFTVMEAHIQRLEAGLPAAMKKLAGGDANRLLSSAGPRWYVGAVRDGRPMIQRYQQSYRGRRERCPPVNDDDNHLWSIAFDLLGGTFTSFSTDAY